MSYSIGTGSAPAWRPSERTVTSVSPGRMRKGRTSIVWSR